MEPIIVRQKEIIQSIEQINSNFKKDSASRKTAEYIKARLTRLDALFEDFQFNHEQLQSYQDKSHDYFTKDMYGQLKNYYNSTRNLIACYLTGEPSSKLDSSVQPNPKVSEYINQQKTNFRAFQRMVHNCNANDLNDKWEIEDKLRNLQYRWDNIDNIHWKIDNILEGSDNAYEEQYTYYENLYEEIKKALNMKLSSSAHLQQSTPKIEIPTFFGNYVQWPTFLDLFQEAIHNNNNLSKSQKMQHLKSKLRGEAEKLIQHLHISSDNYDTAWSIINQRYNNRQLLFTKQIEVFLNQPNIQKQSSFELKRLHDISTETINAIQNLGVDIATWGPLLVHLIIKKLDFETLRDYQEARKFPRELATFRELMDFLETKFTALEPINRKSEGTYKKPTNSGNQLSLKTDMKKSYNYNNSKPSYNRAFHTGIAATKCPLCSNNHALFQCKKFEYMASNEKYNALLKYKICKNCLYVHEHNICNSIKRCKKCDQAHNTLLHDIFSESNMNTARQQQHLPRNVNHVQNNDDEVLLPTVKLQIQARDGTYLTMRGLLDQGSQSTLITENAIQRLGLQRHHFNASVSGIGTLSNKSKGKVKLICKSLYDDYEFITEALIMPRLINNLPSYSFPKKNYVHLQHIQLADPDYNLSKHIDILFDAKIYCNILLEGLLRGLPEQPIAQNTKLGWILSGNVSRTFNCHVVLNGQDDISRFWDMEEISDNNCNELTMEEKFCEDYYVSTTRRLPSGQYVVRLPMKQNFQKYLGASKGKAIAQLKSMEKKFTKNQQLYQEYSKFMREYEELGHMKKCDTETEKISCYLPHHDVHKQESSTTKLRVVFNASSKTSSGYSLNDLMETGPKLQKDIQNLLIQWRFFKYVYSADCEKMYRMILLHNDDQNLQKIVWKNRSNNKLQEYKLCTLGYGVKASPYLALRTMQQLAQDEASNYPVAAKILKNNFYIDDLLAGNNTIEEAKQVQKQLINMLSSAGFNLRKWCSNTPALLQDLHKEQVDPACIEFKYPNSTKTLGLRWNAEADTFQFQNKFDFDNNSDIMTKRDMLAQISKIYDPLGWLSPMTIKAKLHFQNVWLTGIQWDDKISMQLNSELINLLNDLKNINTLTIPRWLGSTGNCIELHGFADASEKVYACCVYLRNKNDDGTIMSRLIAAKTKLAPVTKNITLPRLELCAAELLAKLIEKIKDSLLCQNNIKIFAWTDSMITLGWICGDISRWKTFVANRVNKIIDIIPASCWHHTRSEDNAADCATRGLTSQQLQNNKMWWEGPNWLKNQELDIQNPKINMPKIECKKDIQTNIVQLNSSPLCASLLNKYSTMTRATRVLCWVSRFITNVRDKDGAIKCNYLTAKELKSSQLSFIKIIQSEYFEHEILKLKQGQKISRKSNILTLNPFIDNDGILRVGGRLHYSNLKYNSKHPILIPHDSHLTNLLINEAHKITLHGGPLMTLTYLRNKYWILGGMGAVKKQIRKCVVCRKFSAQKHAQQMASLPENRVTPSRPFTHTGVDFTGYVDIKASKGRGIRVTKGYIAVFVCFSTKAIHLELVSDLSTPSFLAAFKRMCARRGVPKHVYSDNGTNFVGASKVLKKEYQAVIATINKDFLDNISNLGVTWHFNAPSWPSAGGLWEAAVKSTKYHLKRIIGEQKLTYEEFYTLLVQIEGCLNSRPLYRLTENLEDGYLTPGHFLIGAPLISAPLTNSEENISLTTRWKLIEIMQKSFWKKWSAEYLQQLHARYKWQHPTENLKINDIVLVNEEHLPPSKWALAKIHELHPGRDGYVRVVTLKTANGYTKRPITKLTLLPKENDKPLTPHENDMRKTRRVKTKAFHCFTTILLLLFAFITPSYQQVNITKISPNSTLYFDKISDLRIIQDEWKMVTYYNMSTYWQSMNHIETSIKELKNRCKEETTYMHIVTQLEHELLEIKHYNEIMTTMNKPARIKRGLINGIGYAGNYLFGILDDRFAERYENDIMTINTNEKHLLTMLKNQTSIVEAENNILKRNEAMMTEKFRFINDHLKNISRQIGTLNHITYSFDIMTISLSTNIVLSHLRRIQDTIINLITNIYHGKIDLHLLSPSQLQNQLKLISSQIREELSIPVDNVQDLYKLLSIHATLTRKYLIMEIKIPLLHRDIFQLDKIIPIPRVTGEKSIYNMPSTNYIAFNMRKDIFMPITDTDIQQCLKFKDERFLCYENHPIYNINIDKSICDIQFSNKINNDKRRFCRTDIRQCSDSWIKLQQPGAWLYSCCQECTVRILCEGDFSTRQLIGNGIIYLQRGCMIKGREFTINAQHDWKNYIYINDQIDRPYISHSISPLNYIMNTSLSDSVLNSSENHDIMYEYIERQIAVLKSQELENIPKSQDVHNTVIYSILMTIIAAITCYVTYNVWSRWCARRRAIPENRSASATVIEMHPVRGSMTSVDKATSPTFTRSIIFDNLPKP